MDVDSDTDIATLPAQPIKGTILIVFRFAGLELTSLILQELPIPKKVCNPGHEVSKTSDAIYILLFDKVPPSPHLRRYLALNVVDRLRMWKRRLIVVRRIVISSEVVGKVGKMTKKMTRFKRLKSPRLVRV